MANSTSVLIRGEGVAACCCARLLERRGLPFHIAPGARPKAPAILLGERTQKLIADVFEQPSLFEGLARIRKRIVVWGENAKAVAIPHEAILTSDEALLARLQPHAGLASEAARGDEEGWTIYTSRPLPPAVRELTFGTRMADVCPVLLRESAETGACWIESLEAGWLFLMADGERGWLVSVGGPAERAMAKSNLVAAQVSSLEPSMGSFPTHPRIADPLCSDNWMACGTAALGFDPLCGDGTGNATREAILACAVASAALEGKAEADTALVHYRARLQAGFERHLEVSREFYHSGGRGDWWREQVAALDRGIAWCRQERKTVTGFHYRLVGFSLEKIHSAAPVPPTGTNTGE